MDIVGLTRVLQWKRLALILSTLTVTLASPVASESPDPQQAEQKLCEYFEFPRRKLDEAELNRLHPPSRVLHATPERPAVVFTTATGNSGREVCDTFPVVLTSSGKEWWITEFKSNAWNWDEVWTSADRTQIWGTLLFHCESSNGLVVLLHSQDGGWTWQTLSTVGYGEHYMDSYGGIRLVSNGAVEIIGTWSRDGWGPACPADPEATIDGSHGECEGIFFNDSNDGGRTWSFHKAVHGMFYSCQSRDESSVHPLVNHPYATIEELAERFGSSPKPIDESRLPGATSLPFDRALLERATVATRLGRGFLEIPDEAAPQTIYPYVLDSGNRDSQDSQLIKLPLPGYRWVATCGGVVGLLQPAEGTTGETWILQRPKPVRAWTLGKLPALPRAPYAFDSLVSVEDRDLEFHVRRLPAEGISDALGRDIYRSTDEGRTWTYARIEAEDLVPVAQPEIPGLRHPRVMTAEEADRLLSICMERAIAGLVNNNAERPAPVSAAPGIAEITNLLRQLDWRMPRLGSAAWNSSGSEPGELALHFAVTYKGDSMALLKALLDAGADISARNYDGDTALDHAVRENAQDAISILRAREANWGGANERGRTSLHWLADRSFTQGTDWGWKGDPDDITRRIVEHAEFLIDHGADVNAEDEGGKTPLQIATERNPSSALVRLLKEHVAGTQADH